MLKEFIQRRYPPPKDFNEYLPSMIFAFDSCVDFLRDPQRFPNRDINATTTLMWRLKENKKISIVLDQWDLPSLSFIVFNMGLEQIATLIIPTDFLQQINDDPVSQLGNIAYMASQCRDFYSGKIKRDNRNKVNNRAQAFKAETLLTLKKMAIQEGVELPLNSLQHECLTEFPNGLESMPQGMNYPTPTYNPPPHYPGNN